MHHVRSSVESMLRPEVVLDILQNFTLFATDKKHRRLKIDRAAIDEAFARITNDLSEQDRDDLAKRAAKMAVLVKNPERIRAVVRHMVSHYQTKVEPNGFKAQVVVFDRECCVLYKQAMDELIGPEASAVVMHTAAGDPKDWKQYGLGKDEEEKLLDRFRDWQHSSQGERLVQKELRKTLLKYQLHRDRDLFDRSYGYIRQYY